jgi:hypothetical protein
VWDARLSGAPRDAPVGLLHALADLIPEGAASPLIPGRRKALAR